MYAVIETGGKQVRVQAGDIIQIEKVLGDNGSGEVGSTVIFDKVLFVAEPKGSAETAVSDIVLGKPYIAAAKVEGEILAQGRDKKVVIIKMKRRKQYRRTQGHRQEQTQILVTGISAGGKTAELSSAEKKLKTSKFFTNLKPKGLAHTPKTLGSRKKLAAAAAATKAKGKV